MIALLRTLILDEERRSIISIFVKFAWSTRSFFAKSRALAIDSAKRSSAKGSVMKQADAIPHKAIYVVQNTHDAARDSCEVSAMTSRITGAICHSTEQVSHTTFSLCSSTRLDASVKEQMTHSGRKTHPRSPFPPSQGCGWRTEYFLMGNQVTSSSIRIRAIKHVYSYMDASK